MHLAKGETPWFEYAVASLALAGQTESGDGYLVQALAGGVLVAVVDGLGHGPEASQAAACAVETLAAHKEASVTELVQRCHERLQRTRGVAMTLASFCAADFTMCWLGVGNVEGLVLRGDFAAQRAREYVLLRGGVVGYQLPPLRAAVLPIQPDDLLILATDGVQSTFVNELKLRSPVGDIAAGILAKHGKKIDDALVLVGRFRGESP